MISCQIIKLCFSKAYLGKLCGLPRRFHFPCTPPPRPPPLLLTFNRQCLILLYKSGLSNHLSILQFFHPILPFLSRLHLLGPILEFCSSLIFICLSNTCHRVCPATFLRFLCPPSWPLPHQLPSHLTIPCFLSCQPCPHKEWVILGCFLLFFTSPVCLLSLLFWPHSLPWQAYSHCLITCWSYTHLGITTIFCFFLPSRPCINNPHSWSIHYLLLAFC